MDYYGADVAFVDCLCSRFFLRTMGFLLFALCRGCYGNIGYVLYMVYEKRISFSYNYCPWYDGYIFYSCYGRFRAIR